MMSRSNHDKPFYVDIGTSIVAIRCASNHDVIVRYDYVWHPHTLHLANFLCDKMNKEAGIGRPLRNCDVGTPAEQKARYKSFCQRCQRITWDLPCDFDSECIFKWAQMPYEEESK